MSAETTFLLSGFLSLLANTLKDFRTLKIDSTKNFIMTGLMIGFYLFTKGNLFLSMAGLLLVIVFNHFTKNIYGVGDQEALYWIVPGLLLVGWQFVFVFATFLFFFSGVYSAMRTWKKLPMETKIPGFVVLFGAFLLTTAIYLIDPLWHP